MKNKITLMVLSLVLLGLIARASTVLDPSAAVFPTAFSIFLGEKKEVTITLFPQDGYSISNSTYEIKGDTTSVKFTGGSYDGFRKYFTASGELPGEHEIIVVIKGNQVKHSGGYPEPFRIQVKLSITVKLP